MSNDIKAGDVVQAVADSSCPYHVHCPVDAPEMINRIYRVLRIAPDPEIDICCGNLMLANGWWCAGSFRKIDAPSTDIAARITACRPVREKEPA